MARHLRSFERHPEKLTEEIKKIAEADLILWSFPVYYFLIPSQLKRFMELILEKHAKELQGKYCTCLTTSIHFFDHTAHDYMQAVCEDLGMKYLPDLSAGMNDLLKQSFRDNFLKWFDDTNKRASKNSPAVTKFLPVKANQFKYEPRQPTKSSDTKGKRVVLVSDASESDHNLVSMERFFCTCLEDKVERIALKDLGIKGGCRGCLNCGWEGKCIYKDGFQKIFRERILTADAIIFSGSTKDRFLSARFKMFFDRSFFLGHRPELAGKPILWLVSGPLKQLHTLREFLESHAGVSKTLLVDIVSDEVENSERLDALLADGATRLASAMQKPIRKPRMFPAVAGSKIFRDFVYLASAIFRADHLFYKKTGFYDFPQSKRSQRFANFSLYMAMHIPSVRKKVQHQMTRLMLRPYEKIVGSLESKKS